MTDERASSAAKGESTTPPKRIGGYIRIGQEIIATGNCKIYRAHAQRDQAIAWKLLEFANHEGASLTPSVCSVQTVDLEHPCTDCPPSLTVTGCYQALGAGGGCHRYYARRTSDGRNWECGGAPQGQAAHGDYAPCEASEATAAASTKAPSHNFAGSNMRIGKALIGIRDQGVYRTPAAGHASEPSHLRFGNSEQPGADFARFEGLKLSLFDRRLNDKLYLSTCDDPSQALTHCEQRRVYRTSDGTNWQCARVGATKDLLEVLGWADCTVEQSPSLPH